MVVAQQRGHKGGSRADGGCAREGRDGVTWRDGKKKRKRMRKVRSGGDPTEKRKEKGVWSDEEKKRKRMREVRSWGDST